MSSAACFSLILSLATLVLRRPLAVRAGSTSVDSYSYKAEKIYLHQSHYS